MAPGDVDFLKGLVQSQAEEIKEIRKELKQMAALLNKMIGALIFLSIAAPIGAAIIVKFL